jgi:long-chain acyl-CoA synthetase
VEGQHIEVLIKDYDAFLAGGKPDSVVEKVELDDICQIYYTSGTTGEPKGVCLTYRNMIASAFDSIVGLELTRDDIWLHAAPMFHLVDAWSIWSMPLLGATQVMLHFTPEKMMEVVQRTKPTGAGVPPTLINMMANHPKIRDYDLSSLRLIMYGGSPTPLGILQKAVKALPTKYIHGFGITETSGITTLADPKDFRVEGTAEQLALTSNAGRAVPHITLQIFDDHGKSVAVGEVGEVVVSGPRVMREYWQKPKHTADALKNGWYHTGDMGTLDEQSRLYIVDRKKDMMICGGENVYSVEIENVISQHPAVLEVAAIGVPDAQWGEAVKAIVVLREGAAASAEELIGFCRGKIAGYKIPKSVDFSKDQLPKTGPGKVAKRRLRDPFWAGRERKI